MIYQCLRTKMSQQILPKTKDEVLGRYFKFGISTGCNIFHKVYVIIKACHYCWGWEWRCGHCLIVDNKLFYGNPCDRGASCECSVDISWCHVSQPRYWESQIRVPHCSEQNWEVAVGDTDPWAWPLDIILVVRTHKHQLNSCSPDD